ncbi:hypothetical protein ACFX2C_005964 [Malus domestica]
MWDPLSLATHLFSFLSGTWKQEPPSDYSTTKEIKDHDRRRTQNRTLFNRFKNFTLPETSQPSILWPAIGSGADTSLTSMASNPENESTASREV